MKHAKDEKPAIVRGQVTQVRSIDDKGEYRLWVEIQREHVPGNIAMYLGKTVAVEVLDEKKVDKNKQQDPKKPRPYYKVGNVKVKRW